MSRPLVARTVPLPRAASVLRVTALLAVAVAHSGTVAAQDASPHVRRFTTASGLAHNSVHSVVQDRFGFVWVATRRGLQRFDGTTFTAWPQGPEAVPRPGDDLRIRFLDEDDRLWLVTPDELLHVHLGSGEVTTYPGFDRVAAIDRSPDGGIWLAREGDLHRVPHGESLPADTARRMIPPDAALDWMDWGASGLWIAARSGGADRVFLFDHVSRRVREAARTSVGRISRVLEDPSRQVWVGGERGLAVLVPDAADRAGSWSEVRIPADAEALIREAGLSQRAVEHLYLAESGDLWVVADESLIRLRPADGTVSRYGTEEGVIPPFTEPYVDARGIIWVGSLAGGLHRMDPRPRRFVHLGREGDVDPGLAEDFVLSLLEDDDGRLWVGTLGGGLHRMTGPGWRAEGVELPPPPRAGDPPQDAIWALHRDPDGRVWVGTNAALCRLDGPARGRCVRPHDVAAPVVAIADAPEGGLLIAEYRQGVLHYDPEGDRFGPPARWPNVSALTVDRSGTVWAGSRNEGVGRGRSGEVGTEFSRSAALRLRDGTLLFGGTDGLTRVHADRVASVRPPAPVVLTSYGIMGQEGVRGGPLRGAEELQLAWTDNAVTLEFAVLDLEDPVIHRFRYRMDGVDAEWVPSWPGERRVTYAGLPPGAYTFRVRTAGPGEGALVPEASIRILVEPAFWQTAWFRLAVLGILAGGIFPAYRMRRERQLRTVRLRRRMARDLHDDVGASLSAIALMSDAAARGEELAPEVRRRLARIGTSARRMVEQVRDIAWAIGPEADRPGELEARVRDTAAELLPGVRVTFDVESLGPPAALDMMARWELFLAYKEALHNIVRHADASSVTVRLRRRGRHVELTVTDNGVGFDPLATGNGMGLRSLRERAARLAGNLEIRSAPGQGTTVRVTALVSPPRRPEMT